MVQRKVEKMKWRDEPVPFPMIILGSAERTGAVYSPDEDKEKILMPLAKVCVMPQGKLSDALFRLPALVEEEEAVNDGWNRAFRSSRANAAGRPLFDQ